MGFWGNDFYENDITLDIKGMVEDYIDGKITVDNIIDYINTLDEEDDAPLSWIALADMLCQNGIIIKRVNNSAIKSTEFLRKQDSELCSIIDEAMYRIEQAKASGTQKKNKTSAKLSRRDGDIYLYDIRTEFKNHPAFHNCNFGIWKIKEVTISPGKKYDIVYFFSTDYTLDDLQKEISLVKESRFWRLRKGDITPFSDYGKSDATTAFGYRAKLMAERPANIPFDRLHFCGNYKSFPVIPDEVVYIDNDYLPLYYWEDIEERLIYISGINNKQNDS